MRKTRNTCSTSPAKKGIIEQPAGLNMECAYKTESSGNNSMMKFDIGETHRERRK